MKARILHCVDDPNMGGVNFALHSLCGSDILTLAFEFDIRQLDFSRWQNTTLDADIVCFHGASNWRKLLNIAWLRLRHPKIIFILQEHHYSEQFVRHQIAHPQRFYFMLKLSYRLMNKVVSISPSQQRWMLANKLLPADKIAQLGQGRDLSYFIANKSHSPKNANHRVPVLAAYGRFHPQKGFDLLLKAMHQVKSPCRLLLAGEGEQLPLLQQLVSQLDNIKLVGKVDDVPRFLDQCDGVIIPSRWEPFGLVFIESMAMSKAIISTDVDGLGDQIRQHQLQNMGNIVEAKVGGQDDKQFVNSLADAIERYLSSVNSSSALLSSHVPAYVHEQVDNHGQKQQYAQIDDWRTQQWLQLQQAWKSLFVQLLEDKRG
ncbi:glycosyltransferase [Shewanella sp. 5_MG-2023]|uniref:glycosyltransferase n=1 Tax=Shewanella sp. 5_MG-2023 TaxID=3062656 RepID=UPI0026E29F1F|nr:glycosyltransferase [Shewanella sp. 5_MG-2023]MDO6641958.1 glycosyltransferase [Shewanella sp. 5_MG-2023]